MQVTYLDLGVSHDSGQKQAENAHAGSDCWFALPQNIKKTRTRNHAIQYVNDDLTSLTYNFHFYFWERSLTYTFLLNCLHALPSILNAPL